MKFVLNSLISCLRNQIKFSLFLKRKDCHGTAFASFVIETESYYIQLPNVIKQRENNIEIWRNLQNLLNLKMNFFQIHLECSSYLM